MTKTTGASPEAIQFHYDLKNDFYALWLDPTMTYTCAFFSPEENETNLIAAQLRKIDYHATSAHITPGARVLDIGCGWGGMLKRFLNHYNAGEAVGLTLSHEQKNWIEQEPDPRLEIRLENWQDHQPSTPYDAIVSIEALEAFVRPGQSTADRLAIYRHFFSCCRDWLKPGGYFSLQTIAYGNARPEDLDAFISKNIFPESDLPRLAEIAEAIEQQFEIITLINHRQHYLKTIRAWLNAFRQNRAHAVQLVGEQHVKRYEEYLRLCTYIFASGSCDLYRIQLRRIDHPSLTRHACPPNNTTGDFS